MRDPKFEQEVQRKMNDLEFVPSESVWAGIRQGIAPRRRRRAVVLFWWLFPGALLVAGSMLIYRHSVSTGRIATVVPVVKTSKPADGAPNRVAPQVAGGAEFKVGGAGVVDERAEDEKTTKTGGAAIGKTSHGTVGDGTKGEGALVVAEERYQPELIRGWGTRKGINAPPLEWQPVKTAVSGINRPRHVWAVGFAAGGGVASILSGGGTALTTLPSSNHNGGNAAYSSNVGQLSRPLNYPIAGAAGVKQNKTEVQVDYSYWAGIYGERRLSGRWSIDVGLNLHYYSVRFETNEEALYYPSTSASLFGASSYTYALNTANVASGGGVQTYHNNYYFLEVPATLQWRLNRNPSLPLFWRGGVVFSYLMSSNGLYYDNATGNDEKDNGVVRRTQASVQSGLMIGLPVRGVQIQAGPEFQYTLTSMLTVGSGGGHLVYGGLRVALMR
jgi:hypothetical protein